MKSFYQILTAGLLGAAALCPQTAAAIGWPSNYEGVMLQGFYWDSYEDTAWKNLEAQADELSKYFKLIWIPNSGKCEYMGYMPQYWFTNHNSFFGTEEELLSMISTYKEKGTGFIADVVINHRNGATNWYDFPVEEWNGKTWSIGLDGICGNDEMAWAAGQPKPTGNDDTGDNFDGCRDLDHTNPNVQENCKNYVLCLKEKYGYVGTRYDMVKGYSGYYNCIYNEYANVEYSVGEYWDSNYDALKWWIDETGKRSAAFDFALKYCLNEGFTGDMRKLVWKANGATDQPAGLIHFGYQQYAVTFVDNHDTYRDGSKFTGNEIAANAFILMSPGTPCVFLPHYKAYKKEIQRLIDIRNAVGIHNQSPVKVLWTSYDCYMAEVTGSKGKAVVKVGGAMLSPEGYTNADIKAAGSDYCVWTKTNVQGGGNEGGNLENDVAPSALYVIGDVKGENHWDTTNSPKMNKDGNTFSITTTFEPSGTSQTCLFSFIEGLGENWDVANNSANRYGPDVPSESATETGHKGIASGESSSIKKFAKGDGAWLCTAWEILPGTYTLTVDFANMTLTVKESNGDDNNNDDNNDIPAGMPEKFYILGHANGNDWHYATGVEMTKEGSVFSATVDFALPVATKADDEPAYAYFSFAKSLAASWDELNVAGNRFAPAADKTVNAEGDSLTLEESANPADAKAYCILPGKYDVKVDWAGKTISIKKVGESGIWNLPSEVSDKPAMYFNLQGVRVAAPEAGGMYIVVKDGKARKIRL